MNFPSVNLIDERAPVDVVQLIIVVPVPGVGLIYIVCDEEEVPSRRELPEHVYSRTD